MAAGLAFYTMFALLPLAYLLLVVASWGLGVYFDNPREVANAALVTQMSQLIGVETARVEIQRLLVTTLDFGGAWWKAALSSCGLVLAATGVLSSLQNALNKVWGVAPNPGGNPIAAFALKRLVSIGMILGLGFLLIVSLAANAVIRRLVDGLGMAGWGAAGAHHVMSFSVLAVAFAAMYRFLPDARVGWGDTWVGALVTTTLFVSGQLVLQVYLESADVASRVGSASASFAVVLLWIYYSSIILLIGAEFTRVWSAQRGHNVEPEPGAVAIETRVVRE